MTEIKTVGVIGAGQMGGGIAHVFALGGFNVRVHDINADRIAAATSLIEKNIARQVRKGMTSEADAERAVASIKPAPRLADLGECDLIVEAATENLEIKKKLLAELCLHIRKDAFLATNTSSLSITGLAAGTDRPERFIGLHFMNPAPVMQLVEVIRGIATSKETFETIKALVTKLGKTMAVAEDFPAFIVNRVLMPMINEAIYTLY
ncbi:MAG: 3-hydroxybutyryl-CoA dehydrogenase, partial [Amphiplicatus sp.]|nr:3-hydroxybutyryl-CoA dehydrogenase [Amphiplicatus sp.]